MKKLSLSVFIHDLFQSSKVLAALVFVLTAVLITAALAASYCFQNIIENGISKKDIVARTTIEVVDTKKTEFLKQELANKIRPILTPVEDKYVKDNLKSLFNKITKIKAENKTRDAKFAELDDLLDIADTDKRKAAIYFLLSAEESTLNKLYERTNLILDSILQVGVSEADFQKKDIDALLKNNFLKTVPKGQIKVISGLLEQVIVPNLVVDEHATEVARTNAKNSVKPYTVTFKRGETIVKVGEPVTQFKKEALKKAGYTAFELNKGAVFGILALVALTLTFLTVYIRKYEKTFFNFRYMLIQASLLTITAILTVVISHYDVLALYYLLLPAYTIILAIFTSPVLACLSTILLLLLFSVVLSFDQQTIFSLVFTTTMAAYSISKISYSKRFDLIKCGMDIAFMAICTNFLVYLFEWELTGDMLVPMLYIILCSFFSSIVALGVLPIIEKLSRTVTPYGLIELSDHNQKLLSMLQQKAPGTYHHSLMVANLCEAAAEAIGANPILARVGAFYHDIGKLKRPYFFIENQSYFGIENPHSKLNPRLSKMVITSHTKDGVEMAKENGLPQSIINFIQQHHGEGLAGHFYNQALQQEGSENVTQEQFRYPGPKPNTKEAAILMLADAVESAVRSLKNPSQEEIEAMISRIITERLNDGQLSDSPLTLRDIKLIAVTFNRILRGMQHDRVKYQENILNEFEDKSKIRIAEVQDDKIEKKLQKKNPENGKSDEKQP